MSDRYRVVPLEELGNDAVAGQARWHSIRASLGVASFGINAWTATEDGQSIIGKHDEALEHVQRAIALESRFAELARDDDDLASIRDRF